ncbi:uncharacterized protein Z518_03333 [Rhinocladiella mackenziei CBS 650.93]|uniref:Carrier domain-containing protein n=1 Tax=Rhinocladiella mackenziei CBS 650.93 TaxID=1442369 RepID=A0A0D2IZ48_9EURO|nr:uncharacterized protein Z518_03333 [Rhinocladiella mackenziei CBS 650.93]KIX08676.1 hypothetical protein Z518_03333 [Rhinocladiella mackenziei CBS 650.93]
MIINSNNNGISMNGNASHDPTTTNGNASHDHITMKGNGHHTNGYHANGAISNGNGVHINGTNGKNGTHIDPNKGTFSPIAICGMACRLPGGIASPEQLWDFLMEGGDARSRVPESRFNIAAYYSATRKSGAANTEFGYFLDESVDLGALDTSLFSMPRGEVARLDPQQRLLLEVARESIDDAGEVGWKGSNIGVYVGTFSQDWYDAFNQEALKYGIYQATATHDFMMSERLSHEMDLRGPSMTIRTACSSALVGLNEACLAISRGDCNSAIVGGTSIIMAPGLMTAMAEQGVLSPDGSCKTFSANANGYARGEAIVSFYVKSLDAALCDGNPIRSVIAGTATNFDGKTPTLSMPNTVAQETLIRRAYKVAGIDDFGKTGFFECHGTGTSAGDLVETSAVASVFGDQGVHIGSIKPNLGHSEGASGLTSLLKAVLALQWGTIPPNIKSLPLNPKIPFEHVKLKVPQTPLPWPKDREQRVSINSFGVGGANAHVIVESAERYKPSRRAVEEVRSRSNEPQLLLYSANTAQSLNDIIQKHQTFLSNTSLDFADIAYTLANKREHLGHRAFLVATQNTFEPSTPMSSYKTGPPGSQGPPSVVMVFTGQDHQGPGQPSSEPGSAAPNWSLAEELVKPAKTSRVYEAEFAQPLCTAVQIALVDTPATLGVQPAAVVGHSSGEIGAAYAAGGLTAQEAIAIAFHRGATTKVQTQAGGMAAVGLGWDEAAEFLVPGVVRACDNSPSSVTLSGDADKLACVVDAVKQGGPGVPVTTLKAEKAYHSHHMEALGEDYEQAMVESGVVGSAPLIPFFSSVTGMRFGLKEDDKFGPKYWRSNLERSVLFRAAVSGILHCPEITNEVLLELGPHPALAGPLRQILTHNSSKAPYIATLMRNQHGVEAFLQALRKLYTMHVDIDFKTLMPHGSAVSDLPRYAWDHQRMHWYESRVSKEWRHREYPAHDLLGINVPESTELDPVWRDLLRVDNTPWLCDHKLHEGIVFPFAAYVSMAAEAARQVSGILDGVSLRHISVNVALLINEDTPTELVTSLRHHRLTDSLDSDWWEFNISSHNGHVWTKHCTGEVRAESAKSVPTPHPSPESLPRKVDMTKWYATLRRQGLNYGPLFTTLEEVRCSTGEAHTAFGSMRNNRWGDESQYHLHPVILDSYFQMLSIAHSNGVAHTYRRRIPASVEGLTLYRSAEDKLDLDATVVFTEDGLIGHGSCSARGNTILKATGVRVTLFDGPEGDDEANPMPITARCEWVPHIDFKNTAELIQEPQGLAEALPRLNELAQLAIALSQLLTRGIDVQDPSLAKYKAWLGQQSTSQINIDTLSQGLTTLVRNLKGTPAAHAAEAIMTVFNNIGSLLKGEETGFQILNAAADGNLEKLKAFLNYYDHSKYLQSLSHSKPNLRVLEIGAGLGDGTIEILKNLARPDGQILYSRYVFTDSAQAIINIAKERLKGVPNMEFATLDPSQDVAGQGFQGRRFDLVVAVNVLNASPSVRDSLRNVRALLAPEGRLLLQEPTPAQPWAKFVLGTMPSCWSHEQDDRAYEPFVSTKRWQEELQAAGFEDVEPVTSESEALVNSVIVARAVQQKTVPLWSNLLWVTRPSSIGSCDPKYGSVIGLARTLRSERSIDFAVWEVDDVNSPVGSKALLSVLQKFQARQHDEAALDPDYGERSESDSSDEAALTITQQGRMDTLRWAASSAVDPKDNEVEVEVHATGLNFRDVLVAMGIIERNRPTFGYEAAGIVRRVGKNVTKLRIGDRAAFMGMETFSTVVTAPDMLYEKLPDNMSFAEGASMPLAFTTSIYCLITVGRLSKGQSILIHSGCGGVGLAAIQIAQMLGAEIFTTVSSEEKTRYLNETYGIPRNRIFNSRSTSFVDDVMRETNGRGVDLALNSLSAEQLHATWSCIGKWGTMVEIGSPGSREARYDPVPGEPELLLRGPRPDESREATHGC